MRGSVLLDGYGPQRRNVGEMLARLGEYFARTRNYFSMTSPPQWRVSSIALQFYRLLALALVLVGITAAISPLRAQVVQRPKDSQAIIARGIIKVAITKFDLPAFHWRTPDGEFTGPEIAMVRRIGRLLKVGVEFVDDCPTFDSVIDAVASGRADIGVSKLSQTPSRILHVRFSDPYFIVRQAFLFNRATIGKLAAGRPPEDVLRTFNGTIGVIGKSAYVGFAQRNFPDAQIMELRTWEDSIDALMNDRVDAIYRDEFEIRRVLQNNPALNIKFGSAAFTDQKSYLSFAVCDSCVRLQQFINFQISENRVPFTLSGLLSSQARN
jgi:polar amino acid transport system substrate-binding protein